MEMLFITPVNRKNLQLDFLSFLSTPFIEAFGLAMSPKANIMLARFKVNNTAYG